MKSMRFKKHFLYIVLSIFFVYAISPLSYASELGQGADNTAFCSPRLLIVELILSKLNKQKSQDTDVPSGRCLLKKKRAVLSSNKLKTRKDTSKIFIVPDNPASISNQKPIAAIEASCEHSVRKNHHPVHSGLSPPLA